MLAPGLAKDGHKGMHEIRFRHDPSLETGRGKWGRDKVQTETRMWRRAWPEISEVYHSAESMFIQLHALQSKDYAPSFNFSLLLINFLINLEEAIICRINRRHTFAGDYRHFLGFHGTFRSELFCVCWLKVKDLVGCCLFIITNFSTNTRGVTFVYSHA